MNFGLWYNGITHDSGSCNPGSIPGSPTNEQNSNLFYLPAGRQVKKVRPMSNKLDMLVNFRKLYQKKGEVYLRVKVRPNAAETCVKEIMADETVKIDLAAAPVKGKANLEFIKFLAKEFGVDKNQVKIISGAGERVKLVKIIK